MNFSWLQGRIYLTLHKMAKYYNIIRNGHLAPIQLTRNGPGMAAGHNSRRTT